MNPNRTLDGPSGNLCCVDILAILLVVVHSIYTTYMRCEISFSAAPFTS